MQKRIIRIIAGVPYFYHTSKLFKKFGILKVHDIHKFILCQYVHKYTVADFLEVPDHPYNTRNKRRALPTLQRLALTQRTPFHAGTKISCWSKFLSEIFLTAAVFTWGSWLFSMSLPIRQSFDLIFSSWKWKHFNILTYSCKFTICLQSSIVYLPNF